ncbi:MAG: succinate dehydrogenase cytochrome b subunit [Planctomycetota bacterium]
MSRLLRVYKSSIGSKSVMAITGLMLFLFLLGHLAGNALIYKGRDAINSYAKGLHDLGPILWVIRAGLLGVFVAHVATAIRLNHGNKEARPIPYARDDTLKASWASRYMMLTGMVVLAFVVYHLLHFTFNQFAPAEVPMETLADGTVRKDVYAMVVMGFRSPLVSVSYFAAHALLLLHLLHGAASMTQTLGWNHESLRWPLKKGLPALAVVIVLGKVSIPLTILLGLVGGDVS